MTADRCRHRNQRDVCPDCTPGRISSPVPQRPAGPWCKTCGRTEGHWVGAYDPVSGKYGCDGGDT